MEAQLKEEMSARLAAFDASTVIANAAPCNFGAFVELAGQNSPVRWVAKGG